MSTLLHFVMIPIILLKKLALENLKYVWTYRVNFYLQVVISLLYLYQEFGMSIFNTLYISLYNRFPYARDFPFNNVPCVLVTLFELLTLEGWTEVRQLFEGKANAGAEEANVVRINLCCKMFTFLFSTCYFTFIHLSSWQLIWVCSFSWELLSIITMNTNLIIGSYYLRIKVDGWSLCKEYLFNVHINCHLSQVKYRILIGSSTLCYRK